MVSRTINTAKQARRLKLPEMCYNYNVKPLLKNRDNKRSWKVVSTWMYIHIGGTYTLSNKYILGIFDFDGTTANESATIDFLRKAEKENRVDVISPDLPRSFIVTLDRVYYSPIAAATLWKRMEKAAQDVRRQIRSSKDTEISIKDQINGLVSEQDQQTRKVRA